MMKIGEPMAGQSVYCPQCSEQLVVPVQSDPKAESLFQYMKQKRVDDKAEQIIDSFDPAKKEKPAVLPSSAAASVPVNVTPPAVIGQSGSDDKEVVDIWIDQFWTSVPEIQADGTSRGKTPHTLKDPLPEQPAPFSPPPPREESVPEKPSELAEPPEPAELVVSLQPVSPIPAEPAALAVRRKQTLQLFRVWLCTIFFVGFMLGFLFHSLFTRSANISGTKMTDASNSESCVTGHLYYRGFGGERVADVDATVLFLPLDKPPAFLMPHKGLIPEDSGNPAANEGILQIEEIEGLFVRTGVDGSFNVPYQNAGKYLALFISSHSKRPEENSALDPVTVQVLQRYFKDPQGLLGDYSFIRDEYDFTEGRYVLQLTFP